MRVSYRNIPAQYVNFLLEVTPSPVIQTRSGAIRGRKVASEGKSTHFEFLAIPYAQPPVGRLRFKPPKMVRPWTTTFEAMERGPQCYQKSEALGTNVNMSEDCLQLNIYTPDLEKTSKPVMIWIHGGGFVIGSASDYNPERLTREGVIVVTVNYRLGSLGFLTFGNDLVSGNMGLKDQALAIQWVKQNIGQFGGSKNKITIFGESAGGISVHAQVLSPWNYNQLQGAISQSGTMLTYHNMKVSGMREEQFAVYAAETFDCSDDNVKLDEATLQCLQDVDVKQLNEKLSRTDKDFANFAEAVPFEWRPVIDNYASNPFLPLHPMEAMMTGTFNRIPFISGTVKNEGALMVGGMKAQGITKEKIKENWASIGPPLLLTSSTQKNFTFASKMLANISFKYYDHPQAEEGVGADQPLMDLFGDAMFISPDQKTVEIVSKYVPNTFNYHFNQKTDNSLLGTIFKLGKEYTPIHADEIPYLMDGYSIAPNFTAEDLSLSKQMIKYWANFAKYGHPSPSGQELPYWSRVTEEKKVIKVCYQLYFYRIIFQSYMELKIQPEMKTNLYAERMHFWNKMLWDEKENEVERKLQYIKATEFLLKKNF